MAGVGDTDGVSGVAGVAGVAGIDGVGGVEEFVTDDVIGDEIAPCP